ncbi:hypothetical protein B0A49_07938 [Cryomyces minteri]|uniref:Protein RTA1 n=1 Tax=Cryomyces minteri TaxID=331657 RepID=A0A4U0WWM9_9PEZI|nr:hypothetical protein B0A49_07938 [Cryomyces minteri]
MPKRPSPTFDIAKEPGDQMGNYIDGSVWYYAPNEVAPIMFAALFFISGVIHIIQTWHYKSWKTTFLMPLASLLMMAGFIAREVGAYNIQDVGLLIISTVMLLSGPPVFAGANYFLLGRALYYIPYLSPIHPGRVVTTFVGFDLIIETLIGTGASRMVNFNLSAKDRNVGADLVKSALILQAVSFAFFVSIAVAFHLRAQRAGVMNKKMRAVLTTLCVSSALIFVRCIYRIVEFFEGYTGTLYSHESYFWVFEASLMLLVSVLFNFWHPGRFLPRSNKIYLSKDGITELRGPGWADRWHWLVSVFDPFDLYGIFTGRDKRQDFWNQDPAQYEKRAAQTLFIFGSSNPEHV